MNKKVIKNLSLFSNSGIGEYGTNNINIIHNKNEYSVHTVIANELLKERADIFSSNYPDTNMIQGSITDEKIQKEIIKNILEKKPISASFSPPCQGSSGLNAFKNNPLDFRNQLVKSIFNIFNDLKNKNSIKFGYLENVTSFYNEKIPGLIYSLNTNNKLETYNNYIVTNDNKYLNYEYFILTDELDNYLDIDIEYETYELSMNIFDNPLQKKHAIAFNQNNIHIEDDLINYLKEDSKKNNDFLIYPIKIIDYLTESFSKYGYNSELKNIRGEEFGGCQIRQRGFLIFYKKELSINFPRKLFNKSKEKEFNGKTILDSLKILDLIEIIESKEEFEYQKSIGGHKIKLMNNHNYKKINNKIYIDTSISEEEAQKNLIKWNEDKCPNDRIPNLHYGVKLKKRFEMWLKNTPEGKSAYKNKSRIHRPYKIIEVIKKGDSFLIKNNQNLTILEDNKEYFKKNNIIDYINFVTEEMKIREGEKEWGEGKRQWMIKDIEDRKIIETNAINEAKSRLSLKDSPDSYFIFLPIKGFEQATYKRASLNQVSATLTTKNSIGNSNTCHPIFDRTWTVKEYMAIFGIGYILNSDLEYKKSKEYIPPKGIMKIKSFSNLLFEIHGEAIISTVAEQIMKSLIIQYLNKE